MKPRIDVQKVIDLHMVFEGEQTTGWVHTHGMNGFGLPELEMRDIPLFLHVAAAKLLNDICDYMLNSGNSIKVNQTFGDGENCAVRFIRSQPIKGEEGHYEDERWLLIDVPEAYKCSYCEDDDDSPFDSTLN